MWSYEHPLGRRGALALAAGMATSLAGCGLRPLHGGSEGLRVDTELAAIDITTPKDRIGYVLREELLDQLNPRGMSVAGRYDLVVRLQRSINSLIIQLNDDVTRFDLVLAAFYELRDKADGRVLYRSAGRRIASYNQRKAPFATEISQRDAEERAAKELSAFIRTQLALHFAETEA
jgi:LPS-assembly lipoprotein